MRRFFLLLLNLWKQQFKLYLTSAVFGAFIGVFILYPVNDFVYFHEHGVREPSAFNYVLNQLVASINGETPRKTMFYAQVGIVLGILITWLYSFMHKKFQRIQQLSLELERDVMATILQGEGPMMEFKSSFRWDYENARANKNLETVVLKTLAGFLNSRHGGTLLIGVADDGEILGLQNDYNSLNRKDQDGFEQAIMTAISKNLGADLCQFVQVLFHVIDDKDVCRVIIQQAPHPVFAKQGSNPKFYLRTGGGTRDLNIQEATEYIVSRWPK